MKVLNKSNLEIRKSYFLNAFDKKAEEMAIISFGACNYHCPYCKRDCQYIDSYGNVIETKEISIESLKNLIDTEVSKGRRIRLSGGDPCMFPKESLEIAKYVYKKYGQKISIAHNGSVLEFVKLLVPYLEYIALDFKAFYKENLQKITGIKNPFMKQKEIIEICLENNVLVDVRTPVFADTKVEELKQIANIISQYPNVFWTLRKYNEVKGCDFKVPDMDFVVEIAKKIKVEYPTLKIGTRNYWKGGFEIY
ncbi:radical SAM protein [Fusobacterium necrophorum]|uniref:radical SAM protein n=1 Tax=Fusobacterium necrophorum TaxID=859 RepID=UPI00370DF749